MYNKVMLIGNLGKNVELKHTQSGAEVANFSLATSRRYKDSAGNQQSVTQWHNIAVWGKMAGVCNQYLQKGSKVFIEGEIEYQSWDSDSGKKSKTIINARNVTFLDKATSGGGASTPDEDLPF